MIAAYAARSTAPPWERSVLEYAIIHDIPDWKGIKERLNGSLVQRGQSIAG